MTDNMRRFLEKVSLADEAAFENINQLDKAGLIDLAAKYDVALTDADFDKKPEDAEGEVDLEEGDMVAGGGKCYCVVGGGGKGGNRDFTCYCVSAGAGNGKQRDLGCKTLKTTPVVHTGAWRKNGYGDAIPDEELLQIYLDYIPQYYADGLPLCITLGGFFSADPRHPDFYDLPAWHEPEEPQQCLVCSHARHVLYISPEGRAMPCMSLTGEAVQDEFPLIPEEGLAQCITASRYMAFLNTRASEVLAHNPECSVCPWRLWCRGGCRASGLHCSENHDDLLYPDRATCRIFKGGWALRLMQRMKELKPDAACPMAEDASWRKLCD